jgi:hypothetical protein
MKHSSTRDLVEGGEVSGWNPFINSLLHLSEQLEELGIVYADGKAAYAELEEKHNYA